MPKNILLLGAGFTRNWGGWLASELRNRIGLLLEDDLQLSALINAERDFEDALQVLQNKFTTSRNPIAVAMKLQSLQKAISITFQSMNSDLARCQFEFSSDINYSVASYLTKFDSIFTLNQDLLLERHYLTPNTILASSQAKVPGGEIPGMHPQVSQHYHAEDEPLYTRWHPKDSFFCTPGLQPYFKLHGSTNWLSNNGEHLMILGGDKLRAIAYHPILIWYAEKFREFLSEAGARLTVIGYSFRDKHINDIIFSACEKSRMRIMIIGPSGRNILKQASSEMSGVAMGPATSLDRILCFDSIRPLNSTFSGSDPAEHKNLIAFLRLTRPV